MPAFTLPTDSGLQLLQTMQQAVSGVADALDDFEADLSDAQKAGFEAMGPKRAM